MFFFFFKVEMYGDIDFIEVFDRLEEVPVKWALQADPERRCGHAASRTDASTPPESGRSMLGPCPTVSSLLSSNATSGSACDQIDSLQLLPRVGEA